MIWQYFFVLTAGILAVLVQTTLSSYFHDRLVPDFFFVMVVTIGLFKKSMHGAVMAFLLGVLEDRFTGEIPGLYMFARTGVYFAANRLRHRFAPNEPVGQFAIALGLGAFDMIIIFLLLLLFSPGPEWTASDVGFRAIELVINAMFMALLYPLFSFVPGLLEQSAEGTTGLKNRLD